MTEMTRSQIDRLGERLKRQPISDADLTLLDDFRRTFEEPYREIAALLRERLGLEPTGRPSKSRPSIAAKLRRESLRLSQMQDIAGMRVVVPDIERQDAVVAALRAACPNATVIDRRSVPSHGYRAVHIVETLQGHFVEIQVRTDLQHRWAELSEKAADRFGQ